MLGCSSVKSISHETENVFLSFHECRASDFQVIEWKIPAGYVRKKTVNQDGYCEYQFRYPDKSILYISSNTLTGSSLNHQHRLEAGINTYSLNRNQLDTIDNQGVQQNDRFWREVVNGSFSVGFVDASDTTSFSQSFYFITLRDEP